MEYFSRFETVLGMQISRDRKGWTRGFGYLKLKNKSQIELILASDHKIFGKMVSFSPFYPIFKDPIHFEDLILKGF